MSSQSQPLSGYTELIRDASDITRKLRERMVYLENKDAIPTLGYPEPQYLSKGNQFRLSFLYGKLKCSSCNGGAFNANGVSL